MSSLTIHRFPDELSEILFNGDDATLLHLIEIGVYPNNWGYIVSQIDPTDDTMTEDNMWVDGQTQNFTTWGIVEVTE
ncbi:MAG: hypothetical protein DSY80_06155 [Desulfocapsa sp.]|nr:MAG: hypothetical protein DSY80_06155 [Desulfocapsa sp.]